MWAHVTAAPPAPSSLRSDLSPGVDEVIALGLAKDPNERYATASQLARAYAHALGIVEPHPPVSSRLQARAEPGPTVVAD